MGKIKHILVASDFSAPAAAALQNALALAKHFKARVTFLHVATIFDDVDKNDARISTLKSLHGRLVTTASQKVAAYLEGIDTQGVQLETAVRSGFNAAEEILTFIKTEKVDLVALGSHGPKPLSQWLLGSVADKVVKIAHCPVLTVRQGGKTSKPFAGFKRLLVASDFSPNSKKALKMALALASADTEVDVMHVIDDSFLAHYGASGKAALMPDLLRRATETLEKFIGEGKIRAFKGQHILEVGSVSDKILEYAQKRRVDMIVTGQRSRSSDEPILLGSVSDHLVRRSRRPVLVVK